MSTLERAIEIAARHHAGQTDKAGESYILHPLRLMFAVTTPDEQIAAVLHDVVEDTDVTFEQLEAEGFSPAIVDAVRALTKTDGEKRIDAARRAKANPIARVVKLADVTDNMNLTRIREPSAKDYARMEEYRQVRSLLESDV